MKYKSLAITTLCSLAASFAHGISTFDDEFSFLTHIGNGSTYQDWTTYPKDTVLEGNTIDGIYYDSTSSETLVVGSPHGSNWRLGYYRENDRYASFSWETISFVFSDIVDSFGISLSQGNSSQSNSYEGSTIWSVLVDGSYEYFAQANYGTNDFTGEAFLGLSELEGASRFDIRRVSSDANIVWDIRDITYKNASSVPDVGSTLIMLAFSLAATSTLASKKTKGAEQVAPIR